MLFGGLESRIIEGSSTDASTGRDTMLNRSKIRHGKPRRIHDGAVTRRAEPLTRMWWVLPSGLASRRRDPPLLQGYRPFSQASRDTKKGTRDGCEITAFSSAVTTKPPQTCQWGQ